MQEKPRTVAVAALLVLLALAGQGARPLWEPDEGRYVGVSLEMIRLGEWMTPMLNHEIPHFTKPPLTYWSIAASLSALGRSEFAARLPNALAFLATAALVGALAGILAPGRRALAAVMYATSLLPFAGASYITTDTLLALCETVAVWGFVRLRFRGDPWGALVMWAGFGLAFLTKGPPGLLPFPAIAGFVLAEHRLAFRKLVPASGVAMFAALGLGWFAVQSALRPDLPSYLLGEEVAGRLYSSEHHRNPGFLGMLMYVPVAAMALLPWAPLPLLGWRAERAVEPEARRFLAWWLVVPLVAFLAAPSRLPLYLLPLAVPGVLLLAGRLPEDLLDRRGTRWALAAWTVTLMALRVAPGLGSWPHDPRPVADWIRHAAVRAPEEVVFVDRPAEFGLAFYLQAEIEQADLEGRSAPASHYRPVSEPLAEEVAETDGRWTVFVVRDGHGAAFEEAARSAGTPVARRGSWGGLLLYEQGDRGALSETAAAGAPTRSRPGSPASRRR